MTLIYLVAAWLIGIAVASQLVLPTVVWAALVVIALIVLIVFRSHNAARISAGCGLLLCLGAARMSLAQNPLSASDISTHNGSGFVTVEGMISDPPEVRDTS